MEAVGPASRSAIGSLPVRQEVREFARAAEMILSPALLMSELSDDECALIQQYVISLSNAKNPWSRGLPVKYT
jgi:hypothetical protein